MKKLYLLFTVLLSAMVISSVCAGENKSEKLMRCAKTIEDEVGKAVQNKEKPDWSKIWDCKECKGSPYLPRFLDPRDREVTVALSNMIQENSESGTRQAVLELETQLKKEDQKRKMRAVAFVGLGALGMGTAFTLGAFRAFVDGCKWIGESLLK